MDLNFKGMFSNFEEIGLVSKLLCYSDNRVHITFSDKSSLILHSGSSK